MNTPASSLSLSTLRAEIRRTRLAPGDSVLEALLEREPVPLELRQQAAKRAEALVEGIRAAGSPGLMEVFLAEYGLSTEEGVALMCLAEALLRVPDADTIDALIEDRIAASSWSAHLHQSTSPLVNASTWALLLTGKVLDPEPTEGVAGVLQQALKRVGEPVIRAAVKRAMTELGRQFVLGTDIDKAMQRAAGMESLGFTYSYDMLGEAALTAADADEFHDAYASAIKAIAVRCTLADVRENPGISVKLSALHPRYFEAQRERVMGELVPRLLELALQARDAGMGFNVDAEEAARLDLSLDVIEAVLRDPRLAGWDGFGVVVQAYGKRCARVIDWLHALSLELDRRLMVRLVKGAYWDTEVKLAQVEGLREFPVFTRKAATDVSFMACARRLLQYTPRLYPQFATHNANSVAAVLELAKGAVDNSAFEFQRLHGMGEAMHKLVLEQEATRCRIYAPVGPHRDLLAYLVRRLLENGANSSFVNQVVDEGVPASEVAADPFERLAQAKRAVAFAADLYAPSRVNSAGFDLTDADDLAHIEQAREPFQGTTWKAEPLLAVPGVGADTLTIENPALPGDSVGTVTEASADDVRNALDAARPWLAPVAERARVLRVAADLYEANFGELFAILAREAGKALPDAVAELREAVDFLRYYAAEAERRRGAEPRGLFVAVSPWNFPLAIFSGQIAAALAAGNGVLAKPAEATPVIATRAVQLLHEAGVPVESLQLLPGAGGVVGSALVSDARVGGVCFTGSTATAQRINRAMADATDPGAVLIAETGGLNAMIVDSTALPEQAVRDIIISSFQSAGQRCSALRVLYLQKDVAPAFMGMLEGAMRELVLGDPWLLSTDVGPVISAAAKADIDSYLAEAEADGRLMARMDAPGSGHFVAPAVVRVGGIADLPREVFGPVLHVATFAASELDKIIDAINASGYGLTFGLHTRIDSRVEYVTHRVHAGNAYVNRNQIGAVVGSQPFGGEGLSGTGPKAGGPHYVPRFMAAQQGTEPPVTGKAVSPAVVAAALALLPPASSEPLDVTALPGPTGESNSHSLHPRGTVLCLGPSADAARAQLRVARGQGCAALAVAPGVDGRGSLSGWLDRAAVASLPGIDAVVLWSDEADKRAARHALAARDGPIVPLITERDFTSRCWLERHLCVDTTAAGGNASLLAEQD